MFELVGKFDFESRQALFGAVMDSTRARVTEVGAGHFAASLLRAPSVRQILEAQGIDPAPALARLAAPPIGSGTAEMLRRVVETGSPEDIQDLPIPPIGNFAAVPVSEDGRRMITALVARFEKAEFGSLSPAQILEAVIQSSPEVAEVLREFRITASLFGGGGGT